MEQLLLHLFGDYIIQNDWMALNKKKDGLKGWLSCAIHCLTYSLPFLLIANPIQVFMVFITHFILDRTNIVVSILKFRNKGSLENFGFKPERPIYLTLWLLIIFDNTIHLICNFLILKSVGV